MFISTTTLVILFVALYYFASKLEGVEERVAELEEKLDELGLGDNNTYDVESDGDKI